MEQLSETLRRHVQEKGLRPLMNRTGIPLGQLRSVLIGRMPHVDTVEHITAALGMEFYIDPPRPGAADETLDTGTVEPPPAWARRLREELTDVAARLGQRAIQDSLSYPDELVDGDALADELMLASDERDIPGARCVEYHATEPAGSGDSLLDDSTRIGCIPFRRAWLDRLGLDATQCALVRMRGESMEPTLIDGSTILINRPQRRRRVGHIFVVYLDDGLVVKRAGKDPGGRWELVSDNPSWESRPWPDDARVIGEVRWMTRTLG